ncbi:hypothetical protein [uncultured Tateyamaria sp.]|uniref:hypothetical protein n=1 Tax=uncultured Tateyamaria sp. TaxID=455651 RepID=UPI00261CAD73|nr:hypothetical protein [uncultured Tateyamaria sp.]
MSDEQNSFQDRIARIEAQKQTKGGAPGPDLTAPPMGDLTSLRRNASGLSVGDLTEGLFDIPTIRYGLPILIAAVGFGLLTQLAPAGLGKMIAVDMEAVEGEQDLRRNPFNGAAIAHQNMTKFGAFSAPSAEGAVSHPIAVRP